MPNELIHLLAGIGAVVVIWAASKALCTGGSAATGALQSRADAKNAKAAELEDLKVALDAWREWMARNGLPAPGPIIEHEPAPAQPEGGQ